MEQANQWYVIYVASRQEKKVAERLTDLHVVNYLPLVKTLRQWSDRKKMVEIPLFNGYLFVHTGPKQFDQVLQVPGVVAFVKHNGKQAIVRQHEIETIKSLIQYGYDMTSYATQASLKIGDKVMVSDGVLRGQVGELVKEQEKDWFIINFEGFGHSVKVNLPKNILMPA